MMADFRYERQGTVEALPLRSEVERHRNDASE